MTVVSWSYDVINSEFNFLAAGDTLTLTYNVPSTTVMAALVSEPFNVTITGTDIAPTILGETDPPTQAIIAVTIPVCRPCWISVCTFLRPSYGDV